MGLGRLWLEEKENGSVSIGYSDTGVGGYDDYEATYTFDEENKNKLISLLGGNEGADLKALITAEFGEYLEKKVFCTYCDEKGLKYDKSIWIG